MADRGLSAPAIAAYGDDAVNYAYLYEIGFPSATLYYTSYEYGVTAIGSDAAQHPYLSNGLIINNPKISESLEIKPSTVPLTMAGASAALHNLTLYENYRNAPVYIYLHEFSTGETNQIFKGYIDSYKTTENTEKGKSSVIWTLANHWKNWDATEGRFVSNENQQELFTGDVGLEFSTIPTNLHWWGGSSLVERTYVDRFNNTMAISPSSIFDGELKDFGGYEDFSYFKPWTDPMLPAEIDPNEKFKARIPIIYGQKKTSGLPVFTGLEIEGLYIRYLWVAYIISEGTCNDVVDITFDDRSYTDPEISPYVQMVKGTNFHGGADSQTADTDLMTAFPQWTTDHRLRGICYCVIRYSYNEEIWATGVPDPLFELQGKLLYDPRDFSTAYKTNPALVLYDYLTSIRYGKSMTGTDLVGFDTGATYCDTLKTDNLGGSPTQIKLFEFSGAINTSNKIKDNVEKILFTMRGHLPYVNGEYKLVIESDLETGTFVIDKNNIKGDFLVSEGSISSLINSITYDYIDVEANNQTEQVMIESDTLIALDGGRVLKKNYANKYETNRYRAKNRANTLLKKSREQLRVTCYLSNLEAIKLEPGVIVKLTDTLRGWNQKENRIESMDYILADGSIKLNLVEYEPTVYDWEIYGEFLPQVNTDLTSPFTVLPPTGLTLTTGTLALYKNDDGSIISRIYADFVAPATVMISGYIVYLQKTGETEIIYRAINDITDTDLYIEPVEDGQEYTVSVTAVNSLGIESTRATSTKTVLGKSELPVPITSIDTGSIDKNVVNLHWPANTEVDFSHYEVYSYPDDVFGLKILLAKTSGETLNHAVSALTFYWIRCVDTTGNKSTFYPLINGQPGTPDGTTNPADWGDLIGKPPDSSIINTTNFRNEFEVDDYSLWFGATGCTLSQEALPYSGNYAGLFSSTLSAPNPFSVETTFVVIPERIALAFAGKTIRVIVYAKKPATNPSTSFAVAYVATNDGISGWNTFPSPTSYSSFGFTYNVPLNTSGVTTDYLMIWGDTAGLGNGVLIDHVIIDIVESWGDVVDDGSKPSDNADVTQYTDYRISNSTEADSMLTVRNPVGATYSSPSSPEVGVIIVRLPQGWVYTRLKFVIDIYAAGKESTISVGGHIPASAWNNEFAQISGNNGIQNRVTFGHDGGFYCFVGIGIPTTSWADLHVSVRDFQAGNTNYTLAQWENNWDIFIADATLFATYTVSSYITDALIDAASILNQGLLATLHTADYNTDVSGDKPPFNADVTDYTDYRVSNSTEADSMLIVRNPVGATYSSTSSPETGVIIIRMPQGWTFTRLKFVIDIYAGGKESTISVGGQTPLSAWNEPFAQITGNDGIQNRVTFGHDGGFYCFVGIGLTTTSWADLNVSVHDFQAGNTNYSLSQWDNNWDIFIADATLFATYTVSTFIADALIDAASILNQGLLATKHTADYTNDVSGNKPPFNADVTNYTDYRISNSSELDSMLTVAHPAGARYASATSPEVGVIIVRLPQGWVFTRLKFMIDIYAGGKATTISVGGHVPASAWNEPFAQIAGNDAIQNRVTFGHDGGFYCFVGIGLVTTSWADLTVSVRDFQAGNTNYEYDKWEDNWDIFIADATLFATYTISTFITDALIDAASILNQGVLATENEWNNYDNTSYYKEIDFESGEMLLYGPTGTPTGCYSLDHAGLHLTQCAAGTAAATRQMNNPPGMSLATYVDDTRWKATVEVGGLTGNTLIKPLISVGSAVHVGIEFQYNVSGSIYAYGVVFRGGTKYTVQVKTGLLANTPIDLEAHIVLGSHVLFTVDGIAVSWNTNPVISTDGLQTVIFHAEIPYTGHTTGTLDISEFIFERLKP